MSNVRIPQHFILSKENAAQVILDETADPGIRGIWEKVSEDIRRTTGARCSEIGQGQSCSQAVIVCTSGQPLANRLKERLPELGGLDGKWEAFWFGLVDHPLPEVARGLVIAGSDKLGTIYGMFHLSELLGVTAWGFWGDVEPPVYERVILSGPGEPEEAGRTGTAREPEEAGHAGAVWESEEDGRTGTAREPEEAERTVLYRAVENGLSREPAVKYRGFFINDEWPCFGNWTFSHYGGFCAEMYDHVFEYLLRMRGNYLWPAMWSSNFLLDGPGLAAMELASRYGIYIGMSHHEPCMRSGEEFSLLKGADSPYGNEWDYAANTEGLLRFWADGLERVKGFTAFPTIGMRGERDSKLLGEDSTIEENVSLLKEIIKKQRELIARHIREDVDSVPQLFAIYKEVEDYYFGKASGPWSEPEGYGTEAEKDHYGKASRSESEPEGCGTEEEKDHYGKASRPESEPEGYGTKEERDHYGKGEMAGIRGYEELEHVTLLFCDDNFGSMRALPQAWEQDHAGGFGMYYHLDYHGSPISYEWVNSTPLSKIWEQMRQAYEYGIQELWIANVGDVKFQEYPLGYFMNLAFDADGAMADQRNYGSYTVRWLESMFGGRLTEGQITDAAWVLEETVRLHGLRRAESLNDRVWHPAHELETREILERADALEKKNEQLRNAFSGTSCGDGYYSMIYYPAAAVANLIKMHLFAGVNHLYAAQGKAAANRYAELSRACMARDAELAEELAAFSGGKWSGMERASHIGFVNWNDEDWRYPVLHEVTLPSEPRLIVSRADDTRTYTNQYFPIYLDINDFLRAGTERVLLQIANGGRGTVRWEIAERADCLEFSAYRGETAVQDEIELRVLWEMTEPERQAEYVFHVRTERECVPIRVRVKRKEYRKVPAGAFVMEGGLCVMDAADYQEAYPGRFSGKPVSYELLPDYGKYGSGMKALPSTAIFSIEDMVNGTAPRLSYEVWTEQGGPCELELHTSPANPLIYGGQLRVGAAVGDGPARVIEITGEQYRGGDGACRQWAEAVLNQEHTARIPVELQAGLNRITLYALDGGLVLERLILYGENAERRDSYRGPGRSFRKPAGAGPDGN